jgi:hypothetical protein
MENVVNFGIIFDEKDKYLFQALHIRFKLKNIFYFLIVSFFPKAKLKTNIK